MGKITGYHKIKIMTGVLKMETIQVVVAKFLEAQRERLKERTFRDYDSVMDLFCVYLNSYGPNYIDGELKESWEKAYRTDEEAFGKLAPISEVTSSEYAEFLEYFVIRKVAGGESFMKNCARVLKKFSKWLFENEYIDESCYDDLQDYFKGGKASSLSDATKVTDLLYDHSLQNWDAEYEETHEGYFTIVEKDGSQLWLENEFGDGDIDGPLIVPKRIADLCRIGWDLSMLIGKRNGKWYVVEMGNVYPSE